MRRKTTSVKIGSLNLSSERPVVIQSMLNTPTSEVEACVQQAIRIIKAGGELIRITAPGVKEAEKLQAIRAELRRRGYDTPISADIHFVPEAALVAARYVEKVRINPGNFVDKRATFKSLSASEEEYAAGLERLKRKFTEFLQVCRQHGTAVRVGTNHGSLSDRVMNRYGDTPEGMVEATMEYLRVCREVGFEEVVISLKSSDCRVMVEAVRLLVKTMAAEEMYYPLHLGVTEAGEGEDGRIRSAVGIGTLLNEGIGDTIRVSLTEAPEAEIPVAKALVEICRHPEFEDKAEVLRGTQLSPVIVADLSQAAVIDAGVSEALGFERAELSDPVYGERLQAGVMTPEIVYTEVLGPELSKWPDTTTVLVPVDIWDMAHVYNRQASPLYEAAAYEQGMEFSEEVTVFVEIKSLDQWTPALAARLKKEAQTVLVGTFAPDYRLYHALFRRLAQEGINNRVLLHIVLPGTDPEQLSLIAASQLGGFFLDRLAWGLWITTPEISLMEYPLKLSRNILQSAGVRRFKAEFISCPGCGRTLFDLQGAVARVKAAFGHLHTLKIAVMGCVVNGPGEMGDADYGYVGAGNGKVNLYKGRQVVRTAVPEEEAIEALRELIEQG